MANHRVQTEKIWKRAVAVLAVFTVATAAMWYSHQKMSAQRAEIRELTDALGKIIERNVLKKGGKNFVLSALNPLDVEQSRVVFQAKYAFDKNLENGETTTTNIETKVVLNRGDKVWQFQKLAGFKLELDYNDAIVVKPSSVE